MLKISLGLVDGSRAVDDTEGGGGGGREEPPPVPGLRDSSPAEVSEPEAGGEAVGSRTFERRRRRLGQRGAS
jgi:hypothetical protein